MTTDRVPDSDPAPTARRSIGDLVRDLANDTTELVRQEIALARLEVKQNVQDIVRHAGQLAVGGTIASVGLLVFVVFLIVGLGALLGGSYWLSTLIVAVALVAGGAGVGYLGARGLGKVSMTPEESIDSLRETRAWAGEEAADLRAALAAEGSTRHRLPAADTAGAPTPARVRTAALDRQQPSAHEPDSFRGASGDTRLPLSEPLYKRVLHEIGEDDVIGQGAKVAYFMFTSLPPALLVLFALAGFLGGEQLGDFLGAQMQQALPGTADDPDSAAGFLNQFVVDVVSERAPGPLSIGLLIGIWAGSAIFVALADSLNKAYDRADDRSWFRRRAISIGVMVAFLALFIGGSGILIAGPQVADALQLGGAANLAWSILQWPLAFLLVVAAFYLVYYVLPNRDQSGCKLVLLKSSAIAAALWLLATIGFRLYISNFGSYSETYGFVGAILVLLLWMYITGIMMLVGGEISSEMERAA